MTQMQVVACKAVGEKIVKFFLRWFCPSSVAPFAEKGRVLVR